MNIDLRWDGKLSPENIQRLNVVGRLARRQYTEFITEIGSPLQDSIDWWVSEIASRNIFSCPLFDHLCHLMLIQDLMGSGHAIDVIEVDSLAKARSLKAWLKARKATTKVLYRPSARLILRAWLKPGYNWFYCALTFLMRFLAVHLVSGPFSFAKDKPVTLVVTWASDRSFRNKQFFDRFYGPMLNFVPKESLGELVFLPNPEKTWRVFRYHRLVKAASVPILLREQMLRFADYAYALSYPLRLARLRWNSQKFMGFDVDALVRENFRLTIASISSLEGLLAYRFAQRLKECGMPVRLVVDWFENQAISHGSNAGFRTYLPDMPVVGYQAILTTDFYLSTFPTAFEQQSRVIPQTIAVIGRGFIEGKREFCPNLPVKIAPAYRFTSVWSAKGNDERTGFTVLITLTAILKTSVEILEISLAALFLLDEPPQRILLKPHPNVPVSKIQSQVSMSLPETCEIASGSFDQALDRAHVMISTISSTCMEAVARGVPTLIIGSRTGLTMNPIPEGVSPLMSRVCFGPIDLADGIREARRQALGAASATLSLLGHDIRSQYFEKPSPESTLNFLALPRIPGSATSLGNQA